jgi:ATP-dependent Lon protease
VTSTPSQDVLKYPEPIDLHMHLPAGAQKKDGPSAGVAMVCAMVSLMTGACVGRDVGMTGEVSGFLFCGLCVVSGADAGVQITLRGRVTPVGSIKEKVLGGYAAGMSKIILPYGNRKDVEHDVPKEVKERMQFCFVRTVEEALEAAFGKGGLAWRGRGREVLLESRL